MKKGTNRGTWISLLIVLSACIAIAWRLSPRSLPRSEPNEAPPVAARPVPAKDIHAEAGSVSPLEAILESAAKQPASRDGGANPSQWSYRLSKPDHTWVLPPVLNEISDLSTAADSKSLWAASDQKGTVYRIAIKDGSVAQAIDFGPRGDYEGVGEVEGAVIVARVDGTLFRVDTSDGGTTTLETHLGLACSLQGLAWEPNRKRLLLVCKFPMPKLPRARKSFAIYSMNLDTGKLVRQPAIVIPRQAIDDYIGTHPDQPELKQAMGDDFAPSAIAVHPSSGQIFILSGRGTMLVVLEPNGSLVRVEGLDPQVHPHPKGISFASDGTMYIGDKARGESALLHRYAQVGE